MFDFSDFQHDIPDIILESIRFSSHISMIIILENMLDEEKSIFDMRLVRTILFVIISVIIYHLFLKKLFLPTIDQMKKIKDEQNKIKN